VNAPAWTMAEIARRVAAKHGLPGGAALRARIASRAYVRARWEAWAEMYATGRFTAERIGRTFGRSPGTVRHGVRRHAELTPGFVLPERRPATALVIGQLAGGPASIHAIAKAVSLSGDLVSGVLCRLAHRGVVERRGGRPLLWALASREAA
jgi:hypothetical protein